MGTEILLEYFLIKLLLFSFFKIEHRRSPKG